jgi:choline transport protein
MLLQRLLVRVGPLLVMGKHTESHDAVNRPHPLTQSQSGLPFSNWFMRIRTVDGAPLPVNSILASLCICVIIALLNLGGRKIFNSIVGLLTGTLGLTYALSIGCVLWRRCYGAPLPPARWSLGRWGIPLNIIALLYMLTSSIISFFPVFNGTDVANMNW